MTNEITMIPASEITAGSNDRTRFDAAALDELAGSIRENGLLQPITVRPIDEGFEIVAGERRFRACAIAEVDPIPAIIRDLDDEQAAAAMLLENTGRADLDPIDEAHAYATRIERFGWTVAEIAERAGVSEVRVRFRLKLLDLRDDLSELVRSGDLALGYAQTLSDGQLDSNRQLLALRALRENTSPTPAWFRTVVSALAEEQAQEGLFEFGAMPEASETAVEVPSLLTPTTGVATGATLADQAAFWTAEAAAWDALGKSFKRNECLAAAAALNAAAELV